MTLVKLYPSRHFLFRFYQRPCRRSIAFRLEIICKLYAIRLTIIEKTETVSPYSQTGRAHLLLISRTPGMAGGAIGVITLEGNYKI